MLLRHIYFLHSKNSWNYLHMELDCTILRPYQRPCGEWGVNSTLYVSLQGSYRRPSHIKSLPRNKNLTHSNILSFWIVTPSGGSNQKSWIMPRCKCFDFVNLKNIVWKFSDRHDNIRFSRQEYVKIR